MTINIAVDAMGGDYAPREIALGACAAAKANPNLNIYLVGIQSEILRHINPQDYINVSLVHATEVVQNDDKPLLAIRRKRDSSLVVSLNMLKNKEVEAVVSAGNTGAFMAGASLIVGRIPGIGKPALAPILPTQSGRGVIALDIGATMDAKAENMFQYAIMGSMYAQAVRGIDNPRIGLLNVGVEAEKGNEVTRKVFEMLNKSDFNFVGNVEAREVMNDQCDVLVCDGFVGNVLLKAMEGTAQSIFIGIKQAVASGSLKGKIGAMLLKGTLRQFKNTMDYSEHGGAPLLGINGVCIKCHGSSSALTIENALVKQALLMSEHKAIENISTLIGGQANG